MYKLPSIFKTFVFGAGFAIMLQAFYASLKQTGLLDMQPVRIFLKTEENKAPSAHQFPLHYL